MNSGELMEALQLIEKQRGINREEIFLAIENSLLSACKKNFGTSQNIKVDMNKETGEVNIYAQKEVTEDVYDAFLEISLEDAKDINSIYEYGDFVDIPITPEEFGRISAQAAKQVFVQKFREVEREKLFNEFIVKEREIDTCIIRRIENKNIIVSLGKTDAVLTYKEQVHTEQYNVHDRMKVYIVEVKKTTKGPQIVVSRTHYELVKRLFELEVPEVHDGTVEIKGVAREGGSRSKMAVYSKNPNVDAVGTCVGMNGNRVNVVVAELRGERIDIINWNEDPRLFIKEALKPADVYAIEIVDTEDERMAKVVVSDDQLSLAIGKEGQNVRLAARLTGWKIDIKSESQARATDFIDFSNEAILFNDEVSEKSDEYTELN